MANVKPFRGVRCNEKNISKFVCPPYDVISDDEKKRLKSLAPHNMVRLELPDASGKRNKYQESGRFLKEWRKKAILIQDEEPCFYFYEQIFKEGGQNKSRTGFFASLKIENPHKGAVKPHEKTLAKPKEDRLKLIRAVKANLSPIFGLFNDRGGKVVKLGERIKKSEPLSLAKDKEGTSHKVWQVKNTSDVEIVTKALSEQDIFIADGHHRYETSWNYMQERKKKDGKYSKSSECNYVMTYLCPMEDKGLVVWPTHRVFVAPEDIEERIEKYFNVLPESEFAKLSSNPIQPLLIFKNGKKRTLELKDKKVLQKIMPDMCKAYRELGVSILHSILLSDFPADKITYVKEAKEACALASKTKRIAVLVPGTPVKAIKEIALAGQVMPQKSTYFYPKVASGIVIHSVE